MPRDETRVNVHSKLSVVSSIPIGPGKTHPLSAFDHAMGLHTLHMIFYYENKPAGPVWSRETGLSGLDQLNESLSGVLSRFPLVTGRLTRMEDGNWGVKFNDAGVRILMAKVGATVDEWLQSADGAAERDLTVWEDMPNDPCIWSPFRIQINDFEEGGVAIGLSCTHLLADPTSATTLFKSWTDAHRGDSIFHPPLFRAPPVLRGRAAPNTKSNSAYYCATMSKVETSPVKMATATFRFSSSMIKQSLLEVQEKCPSATPFDLLSALFWTRVSRLKVPKLDNTHSLSICIDFRKSLHAKLPNGYFGNAFHFSLLSLDAEELEGAQLGYVAGLVHGHMSGIDEEDFYSVADWLESKNGENGKYAPPFRMYGTELTCINMEHISMYDAKFKKDVKPVHVACHISNAEGEGLIVVMPSPEEGLGRTVTVTLPEEEMAKLREDEAILHWEPTMILSGRQ